MTPDADAGEIRSAYRERARLHHPDRSTVTSDDEMSRINEAYRVLSDPGRRLDYDRAQRAETTSAGATSSAARPSAADRADRPRPGSSLRGRSIYTEELPPARVPWRMLAVVGGAAIAFVIVASVLSEPSEPRAPDGVIRAGSCVEIATNGDAVEVRCTGDGDLVVDRLVPTGERCPTGTVGHRDRLGLGTACVSGANR